MKKIFILLIGIFSLIIFSGCAVSLAADVTPPPDYQPPVAQAPVLAETTAPLLPPDVEEGKSIYLEKCAPCHGENGMGDGVQSPSLPVPAAAIGNYDFAQDKRPQDWYEIVTIGDIENFMPGFQSLNDRERWNVTAYILTLSMQSNLSQAEKVFSDNCASCHAKDNSQGITDFSDFGILINLSHADLVKSIQNGNSEGMPAFQNGLSQEEIDQLANYIRVLGFNNQNNVGNSNSTNLATPITTPSSADALNPELEVFTIKGNIYGIEPIPQDLIITLKVYDTMNLVLEIEAKTDSNGFYSFPELDLVTGQVYQLVTEIDGIEYSSDVLHNPELNADGEVELPINVTTTTTDRSALFAERLHVFFDFLDENTIQVVQLFVINNPTNQVVVPENSDKPIIEYKLPEGAKNLQFEQGDFGSRYIETADGFGDLQQFDANSSTQFLFAYELTYDKGKEIIIDLPLPVEASVFMLPSNSVKLESDQLIFDGNRTVQGMDIQTYSSSNLLDQDEILIKLNGKIKISTQTEDNSLLNIIIGASVLLVAIIVAFLWFKGHSKKQIIEEEESNEDLDAILDAVIALDDAYKSGEIPENAYQTRRNELVSKIKTIQGK